MANYADLRRAIQPSDTLVDLGPEVQRYADLLPIELAVRHGVLVIDVFQGDAILATHGPVHEDIFDALFVHGMTPVPVQSDPDRIRDLQRTVYAQTALAKAETDYMSRRGIRRWLSKPIGVRFAIVFLPTALPIYLAFSFPSLALLLGSVFLVIQSLFRLKHATRKLPHPMRFAAKTQIAFPKISILVPLYREAEILPKLIQRIARLDYASERLEVFLLLEETDRLSRAALTRVDLPENFQVLSVPKGQLQTKPRALNFSLPFTTGSIIGVYDAEDAPHPQQLKSVAAAFARSKAAVCVQAPLDIYNTDKGLLPKLFAIEYAMLFRRQNPSLVARDAPLPLGGTSFFIRRDALLAVGAWDAFNVTEDADLGLRLHAQDLTSTMIAEPTFEEAPVQLSAWIRQRSRWLKGFLLTWVTLQDSRAPATSFLLLLGPVLAALVSVLCLPLWALSIGFDLSPPTVPFWVFTTCALLTECVLFAIGWIALSEKHLRRLRWWLPLMPVYRFLLIPAALKAFKEAIMRPQFWDKTQHGVQG